MSFEEINKRNKQLFDSEHTGSEYRCVVCGRNVTLDCSYSNQGSKLVCTGCMNNMSKVLGVTPWSIFQSMLDLEK